VDISNRGYKIQKVKVTLFVSSCYLLLLSRPLPSVLSGVSVSGKSVVDIDWFWTVFSFWFWAALHCVCNL
jgi:hypothetical protein